MKNIFSHEMIDVLLFPFLFRLLKGNGKLDVM